MASLKSISAPMIMIIDDEEGIRNLLEVKFYREGFRVLVAATAMHAQQMLRGGKEVDLILCDMKMPKMSGLDLFTYTRELQMNVPFILITGYAEKEKIAEAVRLGISDIILKPARHQDIIEKVRRHFSMDISLKAS